MEKEKWLMPHYYKNFKCKCEKCRHTCCHGWRIPISQSEYFHLIGMECSENLHNKLECAFEIPKQITSDCFRYISFNWLGNCPIQKDGLCMLHAEKGEDNLPRVCRLYPRSLKKVNDKLIACCSSSCEAVVETLYYDGSIRLEHGYLDSQPQISYQVEESTMDDLMYYFDIINDSSTSLAESIKQICLLVNKEEFMKDYNIDKNPLTLALEVLSRFSEADNFLSEIYQLIFERYENNYYQYEIDRENFERRYPNWSIFFANVINNSLLYENFPFVDKRFDKCNAYKGLCASYGLLRLICIGYTSVVQTPESIIDAVSELFHLIDHTAFYYNINVICHNSAILLKL